MDNIRGNLLTVFFIGVGFLIGVNAGIPIGVVLIVGCIVLLMSFNNMRGESALGYAYLAPLLIFVVIGIFLGIVYDIGYYVYNSDLHFNLRDLFTPG